MVIEMSAREAYARTLVELGTDLYSDWSTISILELRALSGRCNDDRVPGNPD